MEQCEGAVRLLKSLQHLDSCWRTEGNKRPQSMAGPLFRASLQRSSRLAGLAEDNSATIRWLGAPCRVAYMPAIWANCATSQAYSHAGFWRDTTDRTVPKHLCTMEKQNLDVAAGIWNLHEQSTGDTYIPLLDPGVKGRAFEIFRWPVG